MELLVKEVSVRLVWWRGLLLCFQVCWQPVGWGWRSDVKKVEGGIWTPFSGCTCSRSPESSLLLAFKGSKAMVNPCKSWKGKESKSWYFSCIFSFGSILTAPVEQRRDCASVPVFLQEVVWPRVQVPLNNKISRRVQLWCFHINAKLWNVAITFSCLIPARAEASCLDFSSSSTITEEARYLEMRIYWENILWWDQAKLSTCASDVEKCYLKGGLQKFEEEEKARSLLIQRTCFSKRRIRLQEHPSPPIRKPRGYCTIVIKDIKDLDFRFV